MKAVLIGVAAALTVATVWWSGAETRAPAVATAAPSRLVTAHVAAFRALEDAVGDGGPRRVRGSPELCGAPRPSTGVRGDERAAWSDWLWGRGDCELTLPLRSGALFTPLSRPSLSDHLSEAWALRISSALGELLAAVREDRPVGRRRLWIQHLAWEVVMADERMGGARRAKFRGIRDVAAALLDETRLTRADLAALPADQTLETLVPAGYVELGATEGHADAYAGRLFVRIFVGSDDPGRHAAFVRRLTDPALSRQALRALPEALPGVHTIAVATLTALTDTGAIVPTNQLVAVHEYRYADATALPTLGEELANVSFTSTEYVPDLETGDVRAALVEPAAAAHRSLLQATPMVDGQRWITHDAACADCHRRTITTLGGPIESFRVDPDGRTTALEDSPLGEIHERVRGLLRSGGRQNPGY